jgi:hypothetical protein
MGEGGAVNSPVAVVGAVNDALAPFGIAADHTPLTPEWVLGALGKLDAGSNSGEPMAINRVEAQLK